VQDLEVSWGHDSLRIYTCICFWQSPSKRVSFASQISFLLPSIFFVPLPVKLGWKPMRRTLCDRVGNGMGQL
jgi:hypothetical protein